MWEGRFGGIFSPSLCRVGPTKINSKGQTGVVGVAFPRHDQTVIHVEMRSSLTSRNPSEGM